MWEEIKKRRWLNSNKDFRGVSKNYCYIMLILKTCFSVVTRYNYFIKYMAGQRNLWKENLSEKELE